MASDWITVMQIFNKIWILDKIVCEKEIYDQLHVFGYLFDIFI